MIRPQVKLFEPRGTVAQDEHRPSRRYRRANRPRVMADERRASWIPYGQAVQSGADTPPDDLPF